MNIYNTTFSKLKILIIAGLFQGSTSEAKVSNTRIGDNSTRGEGDFQVSVYKEGFDLLSQKLTESYLADVINQPISDFEEDVGYGIQAHFSGLSYSIDFKEARVSPSKDRLHATVLFNSIVVKANSVRFVKKSGVTLSTTCKDTTMTGGVHAPLQLDIDLLPKIQNGTISVSIPEVGFHIPDNLYEIDGPKKCSGSLGIGELLKYSINRALKNANDRVAEAAKKRIQEFGPKVADQMQSLTTLTLPFRVGGSGGLPQKTLYLTTKPHAFQASPQEARFSVSTAILTKSTNPFVKPTKTEERLSNPTAASVAVRTRMINELLAQVTPILPYTLPLDTSSSPLDQLFNRQSLSSMLPDLTKIQLDQDQILARIGFGQAPRLETRNMLGGTIELSLIVPDLRLYLDIIQNGQSMPYFEMRLSASMGVRLELEDSSLKLSIVTPGNLNVQGSWMPNYQPSIEIFEQDVAHMLFSSVLDILYSAGPLTRIQIPPLPVGPTGSLNVSGAFVDGDFIGVSLSR